MRRAILAILIVALVGVGAAPAQAGKHRGKPSGVEGTVLNTTCPGPCASPPPSPQPYQGSITVEVRRIADGVLAASATTTNGQFRIRVKHGLYDVSAVTPSTPPCGPVPAGAKVVCPVAMPQTCLGGDTVRVGVHRHRFTRVALHVQNVCIV